MAESVIRRFAAKREPSSRRNPAQDLELPRATSACKLVQTRLQRRWLPPIPARAALMTVMREAASHAGPTPSPARSRRFPRASARCHELPLVTARSHGFPATSREFPRIPTDSHGFPRILTDSRPLPLVPARSRPFPPAPRDPRDMWRAEPRAGRSRQRAAPIRPPFVAAAAPRFPWIRLQPAFPQLRPPVLPQLAPHAPPRSPAWPKRWRNDAHRPAAILTPRPGHRPKRWRNDALHPVPRRPAPRTSYH